MIAVTTFEDLQNLGVNAIHEHTHIARHQIELLLGKSFHQLNRVQFMGFVSILEREYAIDLTSLRDEYDAQIPKQTTLEGVSPSAVLQAPSTSRQKWIMGAIGAIAILVVIASMTQGEISTAPKEEVMSLNSAAIEVVEANATLETNTTVEINATESNVSDVNVSEARISVPVQEQNRTIITNPQGLNFGHALSIKPASKVWVGMMDLATGEKTQKVTKEAIAIDTTKNWLFVFGHGRLQILTADGSTTLKERNAIWFAYENGSLQQLSREEFEVKNHGSKW